MAKGYSEEQAAGMMGNIIQESRYSSSADNGSHYGICQWDYNNRWSKCKAFCKQNGLDAYSLEGQLNFMDYELKNYYPNTYNQIISSDNVNYVTDTFRSNYEVCGSAKQTRRNNANDVYNSYASS